ncbi:hypothetical protein Tco_0131986 [Tanacetum coccineum]
MENGCSGVEFEEAVLDLDTAEALQFKLGGVRRRMSWREIILALGLHTIEEIQTDGFGLYWAESEADPRQGGYECLLDRDLIYGVFYGYTPFLYSYQGSYAEVVPQIDYL